MGAHDSIKIAASNIRKASVEKRREADQLRHQLDDKKRDQDRTLVGIADMVRTKAREADQTDDSLSKDHRRTEIRELDRQIMTIRTESSDEQRQLEDQIRTAEQEAMDLEQEAKSLEGRASAMTSFG